LLILVIFFLLLRLLLVVEFQNSGKLFEFELQGHKASMCLTACVSPSVGITLHPYGTGIMLSHLVESSLALSPQLHTLAGLALGLEFLMVFRC
jgi:hypothetical protein